MSHLDDEQLALLGLSERMPSADESAHLRDCADCAAELAQMTRTVLIARTTIDPETLEIPPDRVWAEVARELGFAGAADASSPEVQAPLPAPAPPMPAVRRRPRRVVAWVLAAALVVIAGVGLSTWAALTRLAPAEIATATLDPFPDHASARGTADVKEAADGSRRLTVTLENDEVADAYREVWLIRNDAGALISLGVLDGDGGSFVIPDGVDLEEYSLVDISVESVDGDPAHSGDSIVRGELRGA